MLVELKEIYKTSFSSKGDKYHIRTSAIDTEHITRVVPAEHFKKFLKEGLLPDGLDKNHEFTSVYVSEGHSATEVVVVGSFQQVQKMLTEGRRQVLHG